MIIGASASGSAKFVATLFERLKSGILSSPLPRTAGEIGLTLAVAMKPEIFVAPPLKVLGGDFDTAEVAFVQAPAAVGKSTLVRHLSADCNAPILDLAKVAAGANTLSGSLNELDPEALSQFRAGRLTILVDALDEGLIRSGEWHLEEFLRTAALSVSNSERCPGKLRLIFFGRIPAQESAKTSFEIYSQEISTISIEISFFNETAARDLVHARAQAVLEAQGRGGYAQRRAAVDQVLTTYFSAIEASLSLPEGTLWSNDKGQAFAGYAPVLDTLGYSCAGHRNLAQLQSALHAQAFQQAWGVLETVLESVIARERDEKFVSNLTGWDDVPSSIYDKHEQFSYISQYVRGVPYQISERNKLPSTRQKAYREAIEQFLPNHPFIRGSGFANDVFGALVAAYQICELSAYQDDVAQLEELTKTPFLWRACRSYLGDGNVLLDGDMIGYILTSMWTDSLVENPKLEISDRSGGGANVTIRMSGGNVTFLVTLPLRFVQVIGPDSQISVSGRVVLGGFQHSGSFEISNRVSLRCDDLTIDEKLVRVGNGPIEIDANAVVQPPNLEVTYGKSGGDESRRLTVKRGLATAHPWSVAATERQVRDGEVIDKWVALIERCASRASAVGFPALKQDGSPSDGDASTGWIRLQYEVEFPRLVNEIVKAKLGTLERMQASGATKFRLRVEFDWLELAEAARRPGDARAQLAELVGRLRG